MTNIEFDRHWAWETPTLIAGVIVCERKGLWATTLRRELHDLSHRVFETRSLSDCRERLAAMPGSIVALELTPSTSDATLEFLSRLSPDFPQARVIVLAGPAGRSYHWLLQELGAVHVLHCRRQTPELAAIVRRHLARFPAELDLPEQILAELDCGG